MLHFDWGGGEDAGFNPGKLLWPASLALARNSREFADSGNVCAVGFSGGGPLGNGVRPIASLMPEVTILTLHDARRIHKARFSSYSIESH